MLRKIFKFVLVPPSPWGVPGEGPDCHFLREPLVWADSGPDPGRNVPSIFIVASSADRIIVQHRSVPVCGSVAGISALAWSCFTR